MSGLFESQFMSLNMLLLSEVTLTATDFRKSLLFLFRISNLKIPIRIEVKATTSVVIPAYEPTIRLYENHNGRGINIKNRIDLVLLFHRANVSITVAIISSKLE